MSRGVFSRVKLPVLLLYVVQFSIQRFRGVALVKVPAFRLCGLFGFQPNIRRSNGTILGREANVMPIFVSTAFHIPSGTSTPVGYSLANATGELITLTRNVKVLLTLDDSDQSKRGDHDDASKD